jgi:hypothetical protein
MISALIVASLVLLVNSFLAKLRYFLDYFFFCKMGSAIFDHQYIGLSLYKQEKKKHIGFSTNLGVVRPYENISGIIC